MLWMIFAIAAALTWAIAAIVDKYIMTRLTDDSMVANGVSGFTLFVLFGVVTLIFGATFPPLWVALLAIITGFMFRFAILLYLVAIRKSEISRVNPLLNVKSFFTVVLAVLFLGEQFSVMTYAGMALIVLSTVIFVFKKSSSRWVFDTSIVFAVLAAAMFSIPLILLKVTIQQVPTVWPLFAWIGVGHFVMSAILFAAHRKNFALLKRRDTLFLSFSATLNALANVFLTFALAAGPVAMVAILTQLEPFFALTLALLFSALFPKIINESLVPRDIAQKVLATIIMVLGVILLL